MSEITAAAGHSHHAPKGWMRFLWTTNHKEIGSLYLGLALIMLFVGGAMAMVIRAELYAPGIQVVDPLFFNSMTTAHGLIMLLLVVMPAFTGLANWMIPLMIGAPDMALPRLNNWSFWLLPFAALLLVLTFFMPGGGPSGGWTLYPPLNTSYAPKITMTFVIFAVHLMGISSIMGSINIIVTITNMRAPGMGWMQLPVFVWTWFVTAFLLIAIMPVLAGAVTMMLTDIHFNTSFFEAAGGGDPVLFQHLFWFFGHPEVYVLILPSFGIVSTTLPIFARKPLFGYASMVYATCSIGILSFVVWVHHMFTVGLPIAAEIFFMVATMIIAVPTGIKVFNWLATIFRGSLSFETPMLFSLAFVALFTFGGFTGIMLSMAPVDFQYHDTYFVVGHFHYVLVPGSLFAIYAAVYTWMPKWTGRMMDERLGKIHFWLSFVSVNVTFFPMHFVGLAGMPRRIPDYNLMFADYNMLSSIGAFVFGLSQLVFAWAVIKNAFLQRGAKATETVWDGSKGLEWTVPSPAPYHTFDTPPTYDKKVHAYPH